MKIKLSKNKTLYTAGYLRKKCLDAKTKADSKMLETYFNIYCIAKSQFGFVIVPNPERISELKKCVIK